MSTSGIPPAVQQLIWHQLRTIDHVSVLLVVRTLGSGSGLAISERAMLLPSVATEILEDLVTRGLVVREGAEFRLATDAALADSVAQLDEMYNTRPVTLVRAIYDRPAHILQQFADAFRLRRPQDGT